MSECNPTRNYSPAAQALMDTYYPYGAGNDAKRAEFEARGLVYTNNLALKILSIDRGVNSPQYQIFVGDLPSRLVELLLEVRDTQPDLWRDTVDAYEAVKALGYKQFEALQANDPEAGAIGSALEMAAWRKHELGSAVFNMLPLEPEEALQLCV